MAKVPFPPTPWATRTAFPSWLTFFWEDCTPDSELYVSHAGCPEKAMAIVEKIRERYHNLKYYIYPMLGTMSTQSGPDSIGIFYTKNK